MIAHYGYVMVTLKRNPSRWETNMNMTNFPKNQPLKDLRIFFGVTSNRRSKKDYQIFFEKQRKLEAYQNVTF